jgi:hypothetical protein
MPLAADELLPLFGVSRDGAVGAFAAFCRELPAESEVA